MAQYNDYQDILKPINFIGGAGQSALPNTSNDDRTVINQVSGIYQFNYFIVNSLSDFYALGYYDTPNNDVGNDGLYDSENDYFSIANNSTLIAQHSVQSSIITSVLSPSSYGGSFSDVANVNFNTGLASNADIVVGTVTTGGSMSSSDTAYSMSYISGSRAELWHGDIWLNDDKTTVWDSDSVGSFGYWTTMHEFGHSLGLTHTSSIPSIDNQKYSIMSYNFLTGMNPNINPNTEVTPFGLQLLDIAAIQEIYGRNFSTRAGDTTYSKTTAFVSTRLNDAFIYTIWDGNGADEIDVSGYTNSQGAIVDLRQGEFSSVGYNALGGAAVDNLAIAYHAIIEDVVGTANADILIGNAWDNKLVGGDGNDRIFGDGASVALDSLVSQIKNSDVGFGSVPAEHESGSGAAAATNGSGNDELYGGAGNDTLYGGMGNNILDGGADDDTLITDASDANKFSLADGGTGTDTFGYTGVTNVVIGNGFVQTQASQGSNFEIVRLNESSASSSVYINSMGGNYEFSQSIYQTTPWIDYSAFNVALNLDLIQSNWTVTEVGTSIVDVYNPTNFARFIGSDTGDIMPKTGDVINAGFGDTVWLGTGDDTVTGEGYNLIYSGGDDTVDGSNLLIAYVKFDSTIKAADITFAETNKGTVTVNGNLETYNFDLLVSITGKGTITVTSLTAIVNTLNNTYGFYAPAFDLWNGSGYLFGSSINDVSLSGPSTFTQLDTNPFDEMTLTGTSSGETMNGYGQKDTLNGGAGNDILNGNGGDDTLNGGSDDDYIYGGFGDDTLNGDAGIDIISGGMGNDTIHGGDDDDILLGQNGNDNLYGGAGDDTMTGGNGNDTFFITDLAEITTNGDHITDFNVGDEIDLSGITSLNFIGPELFSGTADEVRYKFENGTTVIEVDSTGDGLVDHQIVIDNQSIHLKETSAGSNIIIVDLNSPYIIGTPLDDVINGGSSDDIILGRQGNDTISGMAGNDILKGEGGNDTYIYTSGLDLFEESSGIETIQFGSGVSVYDLTIADSGANDTLITLNSGTDEILLQDNVHVNVNLHFENLSFENGLVLDFTDYSNWQWGTSAFELIVGNGNDNTILGGAGNDNLKGKGGNDQIDGGDGNDKIWGGAGDDYIFGGLGLDTLRGESGNDTLVGSSDNDTLYGGTDDDILNGGIGSGFDNLFGDAGNDILYATAGNDFLRGGTGSDIFIFDDITDFAGTAAATIKAGFDSNASGDNDVLDIMDIIDFNSSTDTLSNFVSLTDNGSNTTVSVDKDGTDTAFGWTTVAIIQGAAGEWTDAADMLAQNNLIVE